MGKATNTRDKWVSDLIESVTKGWKEELVRKKFHPADVETKSSKTGELSAMRWSTNRRIAGTIRCGRGWMAAAGVGRSWIERGDGHVVAVRFGGKKRNELFVERARQETNELSPLTSHS